MPPAARMEHLITVSGSFHGRVLAARLGAEGVLVELRGLFDGPYPLPGPIDVLVRTDQIDLAREILLADAVEDALEGTGPELGSFGWTTAPESGAVTAGRQDDAPRLVKPPTWDRRRKLYALIALSIVLLLVVAGMSVVASVY